MSFKETEVGLIPEIWEICELKDKVEITMGQSPKSEFYNADGDGIPFMQGRTTFGEKYHSIDTWCTDPKKYAKKNDVLMSVRAPVGDVNIAKMDLCIGRGLASLRMKNGNNEFLYYLLKNYVDIIVSRESGTVFGSINKSGIESLKLPFPNDDEQKAIAHILSTLDEKIETNNQINKKIEEMAQAIFKQWFVDFEFPNEDGEPYKSSGGEMVESELGMIPKGWEVKQLKDLIKFIKGKKPKIISETNFENSEVYLTIDVLNRNSVQYAINDKVVLATKMNILMVMDGASSGTLYYGMNGIVGSTLAKIEVDSKLINEDIVYFFLKNNEDNIKMHLTGSAIPHTDKEFINRLYIAIPEDKDMLTNVVKILSDIRMEIIVNNQTNNSLKNIRDALLPKLMSGEIRVPLK